MGRHGRLGGQTRARREKRRVEWLVCSMEGQCDLCPSKAQAARDRQMGGGAAECTQGELAAAAAEGGERGVDKHGKTRRGKTRETKERVSGWIGMGE